MNDFNRHYKTLELDKILSMLADCTSCDDAARRAMEIQPSGELHEVEDRLARTLCAHDMLARYGGPSFGGLHNTDNSLARAKAGASLTMRELLDVAGNLRVIRTVSGWRENSGQELCVLDDLFSRLTPNKYLEERITSAVLSPEDMADTASPELADIRRKMRAAQDRVRRQLDKMIHSKQISQYLQDAVVTIRNGRFVVPVRNECRSSVPGLVHDSSASGATVFIEPLSCVEANNEIKVLMNKEHEEIVRILQELSELVGSFADAIRVSYDAAVELNIIFAKAQLGYKMKAVIPQINDRGVIRLHRARHPLIDPNKVVPTDIELGGDFDTLIITGPNTGGKTVSMKTVGLLTLMAMCGLMVPAGDRSELSVFRQVLADIGDEQSIEQSLSTFSSHMTNIIDILNAADDSSLIFIDELGAGTDPTEGAALAMAILERLHLMGARVMTTTHYTQLKAYALNTARVENASCEFNIETLAPTYRLLIGVPGRSNAFAISRRLGLGEDVVERAREFVSGDNTRFEDVVEQLEVSRRELDRQREEADRARMEAQHARDEARRKLAEIDEKYDQEIERGRSEAVRIADKARRESQTFLMELDRLKKELKKSGDVEGTASRAKAVSKKKMGELDEIADPIRRNRMEEDYDPNFPIHAGDTVLIADIGSQAQVITPPDKDGNVQVQSGLMKMRVHRDNLRPCKQPKKKNPAGTRSTRGVESRASRAVATTVDLRGMMKEEALLVLDRFIDSAVMSGITDITVVHGKGTGVLRTAVQSYMKKNPRIAEYRLGVYGEGENGVTIAKLK